MGKGENAGNKHFLIFHNVFKSFWSGPLNFELQRRVLKYVSFPITDKPSAPVGPLLVENITHNSADLTWQPPTLDGGLPLKNYLIEYRPTTRSSWIKAGSVEGHVTNFTVADLQEGTEYLFRVTAVNDEGPSQPLESEKAVKPQKKICEYTL